ncbi:MULTISPECIES: hypothetical protein [unclassified Solwaraspora]|uniref:hypothetical protein n=1 Tax=unclassified Solwaraspora TaxID=2627926 RepID=UPI00259B5C99|nr:hypothetical protein [Solwaraspora sp. WMMA2056]WJK40332.1 hypothetical protein O7608_28675 [Solwaraspora sp. WMMA2056]
MAEQETRDGRAARDGRPGRTSNGPGRVLIGVYILFAIAASSRAGVQIATRFGEAPVAYLLSAIAALVYLVAAAGLIVDGQVGRRIAYVCCSVELAGVLGVGAASVAVPAAFPDETVWSGFGSGYGYIPLVLPVIGLWWLFSRSRIQR